MFHTCRIYAGTIGTYTDENCTVLMYAYHCQPLYKFTTNFICGTFIINNTNYTLWISNYAYDIKLSH